MEIGNDICDDCHDALATQREAELIAALKNKRLKWST